jgi:hypothetical protein
MSSERIFVKGLHELFKYAFITNCHLDDESMTLEEAKTMDTFDPIDLLENFKDLILNLLSFKKKSKNQDLCESVIESLVKKHEEEIKGHLVLEQELKAQLEHARVREDELITNYELAVHRVKEAEKFKASQFKPEEIEKWEKIKQELYKKINDLSEKLDYYDNQINCLELENAQLKAGFDLKPFEADCFKPSRSKKCIQYKNITKACQNMDPKQLPEKVPVQSLQKPRDRSASRTPLRDSNKRLDQCDNPKPTVSCHISKPSRSHIRSFSTNFSM